MFGQRPISTIKVFSAQAIAQNDNKVSAVIDLTQISQDRVFSAHGILAGANASIDVEYEICSTRDGTFVVGTNKVKSAFTAGTFFVAFPTAEPVLAPFMKIKVTEKNAGAVTSLDLWINIQ